MADVTQAIARYLRDNIALSQRDISETLKSRRWFLKRLANVIDSRTREPSLYAPDPFVYFGSYFKGTKVKDVDEYDVLVVIDSNTGVFSQAGAEIGTGLGTSSPNYKYAGRFMKSDGSGVSPAKMLNWLKSVVKEITDAYGGDAPERQGQAVTASISSQNVKFDLVPAGKFEHRQNKTTFYNIPRGDKNNGWIVTSPRTDIELLKGVAKNKDHFRNVVRIAKRIRTTYNFLVPPFAMEIAVISHGLSRPWYNDLHHDVRGALLSAASLFRQGKVPDPYDPANNLVSGADNLEWYAERIEKIVGVLDACHTHGHDQSAVDARVKRAFENE